MLEIENEVMVIPYGELIKRNQLKINDEHQEIDSLVIKCYKNIFKRTEQVPAIRDLFKEAQYAFEVGAYDLIYGLPQESLSEDWIALYLSVNGYVFRWGLVTYGKSQMNLFPGLYEGLDLEIEEEEVLLDGPEIRDYTKLLL